MGTVVQPVRGGTGHRTQSSGGRDDRLCHGITGFGDGAVPGRGGSDRGSGRGMLTLREFHAEASIPMQLP
ncbi:hypothetical protein SGUI_0241 [Serinicoccus hydrothermalis]|uniref:Uncharacterized protein n=1 Tax=Serinicoccus hydrothermalis TaxID=1758689 RepID=A0A1B1N882_9MICO|nr:hypothetical protein SGUI_0241 [Serinicoccus hydrothermalis]